MYLNWILTGDKTWCFLYNSQLKQKSGHLEITIITKKEEMATGWVKR
jgi:hypothetical protein